MGTFSYPMSISTMDGENWQDVEATVDTGAFFSMLPGRTLREMGIVPQDNAILDMADRRRVEWEIGEARATIDGVSVTTIVVFGDDDALALLGAYTLEGLRLAVDPIRRRLVPAHLIMY